MNISEVLEVLTGHEKASERRAAAEQLSEAGVMSDDIISALVAGLSDEDSGIKDICSRILSNPGEEYAETAAEKTAPLIANPDIEARNLAGDILITLGQAAITASSAYLKDPDSANRQFACDVLANIGDGSVWNDLKPLLNDEDLNVVAAVIDACGKFKDENLIDDIISLYGTHEDINTVIVEAAGRIEGMKAQEFLSDRLLNEEDFFIKIHCADALAAVADSPDICWYLIDNLPDADPEIQGVLLKTIFAVSFRNELNIELPAEMRDIARRSMADDDPDVRGAGFVALGDEYDKDDTGALLDMLSFGDEDIQQMLLMNLILNGEPSFINGFIKQFANIEDIEATFNDFFASLPLFSEVGNDDNFKFVIDCVAEEMFNSDNSISLATVESLINADKEHTANVLSKLEQSNNPEIAAAVSDIIQQYELRDLF